MPQRKRSGAAQTAPEQWAVDAGSGDVASLTIPAAADRRRVFDIDVRFVVRAPATPSALARHALSVEVNGVREWSRRIDTHAARETTGLTHEALTDSLDYHCRREVDIGESLKVRAVTQVQGATRTSLTIEAEESVGP